MRVAGRHAINGGSADGVAAGWLHDVPEDVAKDAAERDFLLAHIASITSLRTSEIVFGLTDPCKFDAALKVLKRDERKKVSRDFIAQQDTEVKRLKLLDRIDNLAEMVNDMHSGVMRAADFADKYASEAELLGDVLKSADGRLYDELMETVRRTHHAANLLRKQDNPDCVITP